MRKFENFWQPSLVLPLYTAPTTEGAFYGPDTISIPAACLATPNISTSLGLKNEVREYLVIKDDYVCRTFSHTDGRVGRYISLSWFGTMMPFLEWLSSKGMIFEMREEWVDEVIAAESRNDNTHLRYFISEEMKIWLDKNTPNYEFIQAVATSGQLDIGPAFYLSFANERDHILFALHWR